MTKVIFKHATTKQEIELNWDNIEKQLIEEQGHISDDARAKIDKLRKLKIIDEAALKDILL